MNVKQFPVKIHGPTSAHSIGSFYGNNSDGSIVILPVVLFLWSFVVTCLQLELKVCSNFFGVFPLSKAVGTV
jgi:hypothetical protein